MIANLLTFVFAPRSLDVWVGVGGLVALALALVFWARGEHIRNGDALDPPAGEGSQPGPMVR